MGDESQSCRISRRSDRDVDSGNDSWIRGTYTSTGLRGDGYPMYQAASVNVYANEDSHWDIVYDTCGC